MDCVDTEALGSGERVEALETPVELDIVVEAEAPVASSNVVPMPGREGRRFQVIDGGRADDVDAQSRPKMWLCRTCEEDIGVATSVIEPVWQGPLREGSKVRLSSGTKRLVCTHCKMRGKLTFAD